LADQLCTTAQVKARVGVTDTTDDVLISELIDEVTDWIQQYVGRRIVPISSATYIRDTSYGYSFYFPQGIRTVSALSVATSNQPPTGGTYTVVPATDYKLYPEAPMQGWPATELRLLRAAVGSIRSFRDAENGLTITCTSGFTATPPDMASVAIDAVVAAYTNRQDGASGVIGADVMAVTPWSEFFSRGSPQRGTIERYRDYAV
jgi:hypothetical protein